MATKKQTQTETKRVPDLSTEIDIENATVTVNFSNGQRAVVRVADLAPDTAAYAVLHGIKQKLIDGAAKSKGASVAEKAEAVMDIAARLSEGGTWNSETRAGGGGGQQSLILRALKRLYNGRFDDERLREMIKPMDKKQQAALLASDQLRDIVAAIREEDAKKAADTEFDANAFFEQLGTPRKTE